MLALLLHNIRSIHNVGSILRTADGFGVESVIFSGYTPYPRLSDDPRLPHVATRQTAALHKTALGAETSLFMSRYDDPLAAIAAYRKEGCSVVGLEQDMHSIPLATYRPSGRTLLLLGEEVDGIDSELRHQCDELLEIPMQGHKESFNVSVAAGIALYALGTAGPKA